MSFNFYPARTLIDLQRELNGYKEVITKLENSSGGTFQTTKGVILSVNQDRTLYKVLMTKEDVVVQDVPLFMDKAYYQIIGFPNTGDVVKVFHFNNFDNAFIITKAYKHNGDLIMPKGSSIAMGANMP
jgi:hypothetical protein